MLIIPNLDEYHQLYSGKVSGFQLKKGGNYFSPRAKIPQDIYEGKGISLSPYISKAAHGQLEEHMVTCFYT